MTQSNPNQENNILVEKALLSSLMFDNNASYEIDSLSITPDDFLDPKHQIVYKHFVDLRKKGLEVDFISLADSLSKTGELDNAGGKVFLASIYEDYANPANITHYATRVKERSIAKGVLRKAKELQTFALDQNLSKDELIENVNRTLLELNDSADQGASLEIKDSIFEVIKSLQDKNGDEALTKTGFKSLDLKIEGLLPGQLIILAARPSMGKTALALNIAKSVAEKYSEQVLIFSLEMLHKELSERLISTEAEVNSRKFKSRDFNSDELRRIGNAAGKCANLPLIVDDFSGSTIYRIRNQCLRHKAKYKKLRLVVIDYLQLIPYEEGRKGNKADDIAILTRNLKLLSKEIGCPIICLSQLNRGVETRDNKRPILADLRDSGAIEQDADQVWFIYRDEVYNPETKSAAEAEVIIAKNRGGETGTAKLSWQGEFTKFSDLRIEDKKNDNTIFRITPTKFS